MKHIVIHQIVSHTCQQLNVDNQLYGSSIPSARGGGGKKRKGADNSEYLSTIAETNSQTATLNETMPNKQVADHKKNVMDIKRQVQKMERGGDPVEDIEFEKIYLREVEQALEEGIQHLDEPRTINMSLFQDKNDVKEHRQPEM